MFHVFYFCNDFNYVIHESRILSKKIPFTKYATWWKVRDLYISNVETDSKILNRVSRTMSDDVKGNQPFCSRASRSNVFPPLNTNACYCMIRASAPA